MKITQIQHSRISDIDFSNLLFGRVFSDHMFICDFKDGEWVNPEVLPYGPIKMFPATQVIHYGQSIFEGMKAFKNNQGDILFFRRTDNFNRLNKSAIRLSIPQIEENIFMNGLDKLLQLDSNWCRSEKGYSLYIRPFIFASAECVKASSSEEFKFMIITSPTLNYYPNAIDLVIEEKFSRATQGGVGNIKAAGNYAGSFYPTKMANAKGFTQVIWTDSKEHKYIEESGTMNIFFRINDKLITPKLSDSILSGITRDSIIRLAKDKGIEVEERVISVDEIVETWKEGQLKEVFGSGTAVTVVSARSITLKENKMNISDQEDSYAAMLKKSLQDIQYGRSEDLYNWTTKLKS
jgi:branched-chain amino acid aminotransferase